MAKTKAEPKIELTELYCPKCGCILTDSQWKSMTWKGKMAKTCQNNHVWDITQGRYLEFEAVHFEKCVDCGESMPAWYMQDKPDVKSGKIRILICRKCLDKSQAAWKMDKEKSFARLTITPVRKSDSLTYKYTTEVKINPYPNPFSWGGFWGMGAANTKEELDQAITRFKAEGERLKANGMEKIEVITEPESVKAEQRPLVTYTETKRANRNETIKPNVETIPPKPEPEVKQLVLI
jgi:hypothetical protein